MPILAICRGTQALNIVRGGALHQHLPDLSGESHRQTIPGTEPSHPVEIEPDSLLAAAFGGGEVEVDRRQLLPPPGDRPARQGPAGERAGARRDGRGDRGPEPPLPDRRPVARRDARPPRRRGGALPPLRRRLPRRRRRVRARRARAARSRDGGVLRDDVAGLGDLAGAPRAGRLHGRDRGGGDAPRLADLGAGAPDRLGPAAPPPRRAPRASPPRRTARRSRSRPRVHGTIGDGGGRTRGAAEGARRDPEAARHAGGERRHPPLRGLAGDRRHRGRALRVRLRLDARAGPPRADLRPPRPHRRARRRAGDPRRQPPAHRAAAAAGALGQLAVLAGSRHRPRLGADAALPGLPPGRRPARLPQLRGVRRVGRRADPLRRGARADLPLVGRPPAAALRHGRGADHGRADDPRRHRRPGGAGPVDRPPRGRGRRRHLRHAGSRPRSSPRTASSPPATAWRPS